MSAAQATPRFVSKFLALMLLTVLGPLGFSACDSQETAAPPDQDSITVIGMISGGQSDSISLEASTHPADVIRGAGRTVTTVALFPNRTFELRAHWPTESNIDISYAGERILRNVYMRPGDTLTLRKEDEDVIAVGSALYKFQQDFAVRFFDSEPTKMEYERRFGMPPPAYASYVDRRLTDQVGMVRGAFPLGSDDSTFMQHMMDRVEYSWAYDRLQYAWKTSDENKATLERDKEAYYEFLSSVRVDNPNALTSDEYLAFLLGYTEFLYDSLTSFRAEQSETADMNRITNEAAERLRLIDEYFDGQVEQTCKALYLHSEIKTLAFLGAADTQSKTLFNFLDRRNALLDSLYADFRANTNDREFLQLLEDHYKETLQKPSLPEL